MGEEVEGGVLQRQRPASELHDSASSQAFSSRFLVSATFPSKPQQIHTPPVQWLAIPKVEFGTTSTGKLISANRSLQNAVLSKNCI